MRAVNAGKQTLSFSKSNRLTSDFVSTTSWKKNLVVSSVAMPVGSTQPTRPRSLSRVAHALGKDGVDVDVAPTAERVAAAVAHEVALALGLARVVEELLIERGVAWP